MSIAPHCIFYVASHVENRVWPSWSLLWVIVPLVFYVLCVIYDMCKGFTAEDIEARHPSDWRPIWETSAAVSGRDSDDPEVDSCSKNIDE